jgi:hypothetical protein
VLTEQQQDFVLQSRTGELPDQIRGGRLRQQTEGSALKAETESLFEPDRSENTRGIVLETSCMEDADRARTKIALPSIGVEHATELARIELHRDGIDREIPPVEVLFNRSRMDRRQDSGLRIGLSPSCRNIHLKTVWEYQARCSKSFEHCQPRPKSISQQSRKGNPIPFHGQIEIQSDAPEQEVSNHATHDIDLTASLIPESANLSK